MNPIQPADDLPIHLLAAYVDGELNERDCARLEAWLVEHPEFRTELFEQSQLSAANAEFREAIQPPMPKASQWDRAFIHIENQLSNRAMANRQRLRANRFWSPVLALAGLAATLLVSVLLLESDPVGVKSVTSVRVLAANDEADLIYPVATADDVEIIQLPEVTSSMIVVGRHPALDTPIVLASSSDLDIFNLGPDDQGRMPRVDFGADSNAPMLVAQSSSR